jgi:hypothetical protein
MNLEKATASDMFKTLKSRDELPDLLFKLGYRVGAEIGVWRGSYAEKFCQAGLKMYAIDPWAPYIGAGRSQKITASQDENYQMAKDRLAPYDCTILRASSMAALRYFAKGQLDFIYIDGNHMLPYVIQDIWHWDRKVKSGGIISGHDYFCTRPPAIRNTICHVQPAVDACAQVMGVGQVFIFGGEAPRGDMDHCKSWAWIKP